MNAILARNLEIPRYLLAILFAIAGGFWGLVALFSDYPLDSSYAEWVVYVLGIHAFVGFLIGLLLPSRWLLSIAAAWGAFLLDIMSVISLFRASGSTSDQPVGAFMVAASVLMVIAVPAAAAAGGYAGSRLVTRRWW